MSALSRAKAAFVFRYFLDRTSSKDINGNYRSVSLEGTTTYDDGLDFVVEFGDAFPGRTEDPNHLRASARLRRLLKQLWADGWLDRGRLSNHDQYHPREEPNWQMVYRLKPWLINDLAYGRLTPEQAAERWAGPTPQTLDADGRG